MSGQTIRLTVANKDEVTARALAAFKGKKQGAHISFATVELLWKVLTPRRWEIIKALTGEPPLAIREIARRVGRDVKAVHGDVHGLLEAGILDRASDGGILFRFDAVHVDFTLTKAA